MDLSENGGWRQVQSLAGLSKTAEFSDGDECPRMRQFQCLTPGERLYRNFTFFERLSLKLQISFGKCYLYTSQDQWVGLFNGFCLKQGDSNSATSTFDLHSATSGVCNGQHWFFTGGERLHRRDR